MDIFIPAIHAYRFEHRADISFVGDNSLFERDGYIGLFNKNALETNYFKNPRPHPTKWGWIAETDEIPKYFSRIIEQLEKAPDGK